jgi:hypothetical protein
VIVACFMGACVVTARVEAHHSAAAYYDVNKTVTVTGIVTKIEWRNPHVFIFVQTSTSGGKGALWSLETESPIALEQLGFRRTDIRPGETITIDVMPALHTPHRGRIRAFTHRGKTFVDTAIGGRGR